ncbi:MAG: hypothetical protein KF825_10610 [Ferruginibacter sp.]|nr:hypothetical protein [Ferruginibacter sp.]
MTVFSNTGKASSQLVYSYNSDGVGYSDIQMLYNTDSNVRAQPFFKRPSLQTTSVNISCKIRKTIIESANNNLQVCFEILSPVVKIENNSLPVDVDAITKEMIIPVFAEMSVKGNILNIKTDSSVSYITTGIIKNILSNTQTVILSTHKKSWLVTEENTNGLFNAKYTVVNKYADSTEYLKINTGYEKIRSAKKNQKLLPQNVTAVIINKYGNIQRIHTSESLITMFGTDTIVASGSSTEFVLLSSTTADQKEILNFQQIAHSGKYLKSVALSDPISDEEINRLAYKNTLADDNFESLVAKLKLVNIKNKQFEDDLSKKFRALAWLSEVDCSRMAELLKNAEPGSDTFSVISGALAAVETPFSINELASIISARRNEEAVLVELLPVLAVSPTPTANAADIIREIAFSKLSNPVIRSMAQLTLGGMVKNLESIDRKKTEELTGVIVDKMKNSTDTIQQLLVYGNTGSYRLLPVYYSYLSDTAVSVEIKKAAVFAMRFVNYIEVDSLLVNLSTGNDSLLSKAANETISFRKEYLNENY